LTSTEARGRSRDGLLYLERHHQADIEISAREPNKINVSLVETLPGKDDSEATRVRKSLLFFTTISDELPKNIIARAVEAAHRILGGRVLYERNILKQNLAALQQTIAQLASQAQNLAGVKPEW
jgi:hypothetical protein